MVRLEWNEYNSYGKMYEVKYDALIELGRLAEAKESCDEAMYMVPEEYEAQKGVILKYLADIALQEGDLPRADSLSMQSMLYLNERFGENTPPAVRKHNVRVEVLIALGRYEKAYSMANNALGILQEYEPRDVSTLEVYEHLKIEAGSHLN